VKDEEVIGAAEADAEETGALEATETETDPRNGNWEVCHKNKE